MPVDCDKVGIYFIKLKNDMFIFYLVDIYVTNLYVVEISFYYIY